MASVGGACNFLGSVSSQQKFEATDRLVLQPLDRPMLQSWMDQCYSSVSQLSFIYKVRENTSSRHEGMPIQKTQREERPPSPILALIFIRFFILPLDLPYVNWASQGYCLFHSGPRTFLCSIFEGFSLPCLLATDILDSFFLFYLPNTFL